MKHSLPSLAWLLAAPILQPTQPIHAADNPVEALIGAAVSSQGARGNASCAVTWLGVGADVASQEVLAQLPLPSGTGLCVQTVAPSSPAAKAGLKQYDVLAKFDDQVLINADQLKSLVTARAEGDQVKLTVYRQGKEIVMEAVLTTHTEASSNVPKSAFPKAPKTASHSVVLGSRTIVTDSKGNIIADTSQGNALNSSDLEKALNAAGIRGELRGASSKLLEAALIDRGRDAKSTDTPKKQSLRELEDKAANLAKALEEIREEVEAARKREGLDD